MTEFVDDLQSLAGKSCLVAETIDGVYRCSTQADMNYADLAACLRKHDRILIIRNNSLEFHPINSIEMDPIVLPGEINTAVMGASHHSRKTSGGVVLHTYKCPNVATPVLDAIVARKDTLKIVVAKESVTIYAVRNNDNKGGLAHCKRRGVTFNPSRRKSQWPKTSTAGKAARAKIKTPFALVAKACSAFWPSQPSQPTSKQQ